MSNRRHRAAALTLLGGLCLTPAAQAKINLDLDYSLDSNNFFTPAARAALQQAATVFTDRILDTLPAIVPGNGQTWSTNFDNPSTGVEDSPKFTDLTIPANTLKVFVGGRALGGALGIGGPGGFGGTRTLFDQIHYRGQPGASASPPTDYSGYWGGTISFDNTVPWNFDLAAARADRHDFLSVATHELAHVLGFGTAESWRANYATASGFEGPKAVALYGGLVPLNPATNQSPGGDHFNYGVMSTTASGVAQETLMDPDIITGTRKAMTLLDWAALDDLGWDLARPGDANADGTVNFDDLLVLAKNYNRLTTRWSEADFNSDGVVNFDDLLQLAKNYNATTPQPGAMPDATSAAFAADWSTAQALAAVPEPTTTALLALAAIPALASRRRRRAS
jgi:hypothetical protein